MRVSGRRGLGALAAVALTATLLAGCADAPRGTAPIQSTESTESSAALEGTVGRAVDLLPTVWHVIGAAGADPDTYLLFSAGEVEVLLPKGFVLLGWSTQGDAMLTQAYGWAQALGTKGPPEVPWLTAAAFFRKVDSGRVLLDEDGRRLAELRDDGPAPSSSTTITTPSPISAFDRTRLADARPGAGARTTPMSAVTGSWGVAGLDSEHARLTIDRSGEWRVRGGCASDTGQDLGGAGRLRLLPGGSVLLTAGPVAGVGCSEPTRKPPADAAALISFASARSLRVEEGRMTLFDERGERIGQLVRQG